MQVGDEVEVRLAGKVVELSGGCALVEIFLARPTKGNIYRTFVAEEKCFPATEDSIRQKVVQVPQVEA